MATISTTSPFVNFKTDSQQFLKRIDPRAWLHGSRLWPGVDVLGPIRIGVGSRVLGLRGFLIRVMLSVVFTLGERLLVLFRL